MDIKSNDGELIYLVCMLCAELDGLMNEMVAKKIATIYHPRLSKIGALKDSISRMVLGENTPGNN